MGRWQLWLITASIIGTSTTLFATDHGSAATPYPAAAHLGDGLLRLGETRGTDDGSSVGESPWTPGKVSANLTVLVSGVGGGSLAKVDAWVDFNRDGNFGGAWEKIASDVPVGNGSHTLSFPIPSEARIGIVQGRVRLSSDGSAASGGNATDGEVEDPLFTIAPAAKITGYFDEPRAVGDVTLPQTARGGDIDSDGDVDVVITSGGSGAILLLENTGASEWPPVFEPLRAVPSALPSAQALELADIDGDGDLDLVVGTEMPDGRVAWFENEAGSFSHHPITNEAGRVRSLAIADIDGDGDLDILAGGYGSARWIENIDSASTWIPHALPSINPLDIQVGAVDLDRDGDMDVVSKDSGLAWFKNDGAQTFVREYLGTIAPLPDTADMDGDGDIDLVSAGTYLRIIANQGTGFSSPARRRVPGELETALADLDGDSDLDVIGVPNRNYLTWGAMHVLQWYDNRSNGFEARPIWSGGAGFSSLALLDLDNDGDLDLLGADRANNRVSVVENTQFIYEFFPSSPTVLEEGDFKEFHITRHGRFPLEESTALVRFVGHGDHPGDADTDLVLPEIAYTFGLNDRNGSFDVHIADDDIVEPREEFLMQIVSPRGELSELRIIIHDNDTDYGIWTTEHFPIEVPEADLVGSADPDGDGRNNLAEYYFATDPLAFDPLPLSVEQREPEGIQLRFQRRRGTVDVAAGFQSSRDLQRWDPLAVPADAISTTRVSSDIEEVVVEIPPPHVGSNFRMSLTLD